jgi:hypothetical protein
MTDTEIDNLSGDVLDAAIAWAMEPNRPKRYVKTKWWKYSGWDDQLVAARHVATDGGNIAADLLEMLREWGYAVDIAISARMNGSVFAGVPREFSAEAATLPLAVARLFLRVYEVRKGKS